MRLLLLFALIGMGAAYAEGFHVIDGDRPQTWFHMIGGNVSKAGLTADLEAIKSAGIGGIQFFHGQMGSAYPWPRTHEQIPCLSEKWDGLVGFAADECARLGLKFEMQNCPGWSMSGGPWITHDTAMRKLVCFRPGKKPAFEADDDYREIGKVSLPKPAGWEDSDPMPASVVTNDDVRLYRFSSPVTIRTLELPPPNTFNRAFAYEKWLHVRFEAKTSEGWKTVVDADYPRGCWQDGTPTSFACGETSGTEWRLTFVHSKPIDNVDFVRFRSVAKLNAFEALGGWAFRDLPRSVILPARVNGTAELVFGHVNMKVKNGPAPEEARGWECDKLDPKGFEANFAGYLGRLMKGPLAGGKLKGMVVDSWECGRQSWTERMEEYFEKRNGYALRPNLPVLFGYPVGDAESTEKFLRDWRRTISYLIEENYYRVFAELGRKSGLTVQFETAFRRVQAEALTSSSLDWDEDFNRFKRVIDHHFARGVTHLVFHTYTHNPQIGKDFLPPGTSFAWCIGSPFLRGQTWWKYMPLLTDYAARCGHELERGRPVVDVLWYLGDDNPYRPDENAEFPKGYKYDYITQDALLERLSVRDGRLMLPDGMSYRLLWIPDGTLLLPESTKKLAELEQAGARICRGELKIDWPSPLKSLTGCDPEDVEWYQRRDGGEDVFFIVEKSGASRFLYLNGKTNEVQMGDPMTGEVKPFSVSEASVDSQALDVFPCADYPAWATEREYVMTVDVGEKVSKSRTLDLGEVRSWAEVFVNGRFVRTLWAAPYACDIGSALKPGKNELKVKVTSTWFNRLVHDTGLQESERKTWTIRGPAADAEMRPGGLLGPVRLGQQGGAQ